MLLPTPAAADTAAATGIRLLLPATAMLLLLCVMCATAATAATAV
jgi:hypothetical protein